MAKQQVVKKPGFRWEIEGLRAVAALLVAGYHVWFGRVSGGVDVFFVIAGFMITTTLLGHLERTGRLDIRRYLSGLAQRLLPHTLLVLAVVGVASWSLIPVTRRDEVFAEIAASALYYQNWELARRSVDYLERDVTSSPVQHFWAMSIQGQFYLIWLVLFLVVLKVGTVALARRRLAIAMGVLVAGSLAFSVWLTEVSQPVAYFNTGTRVWEFGIGGLLALSLPWWPRMHTRTSFTLGWVGLLAILACGAVLSVGTSFPGWIALWPVTGAALILLAGHTDARWSASTLLSSTPLVRLGSVSYALYLWHWPLLVFVLVLSGQDSVGPLGGLGVIAAAIALSFASTHLVERPIRSLSLDGPRSWSVPLLLTLLVLPVAGTGYAVAGSNDDIGAITTGDDPQRYPGAGAAGPDATSLTRVNTDNPAPGVEFAPDDIPEVYAAGCDQAQAVDEVVVCEYGDPDADRTMILTGGSHSAHWQPALKLIAEQRGWRLLSATKTSCRSGSHLMPRDSDDASIHRHPKSKKGAQESCRQWNADSEAWILQEQPDVVVLTSTTGIGEEETVPRGYVRFWENLAAQDIQVLAIRDTPIPSRNIPDCLATNGALTRACDTDRDEVMADPPATVDADGIPKNVTLVDLTDSLCDAQTCPPVIGNVVVFSDGDHVTATFSRTLAERLVRVATVLH